MQAKIGTRNVPAAILLIAAMLMNIAIMWLNYQLTGWGINFADYLFATPFSIIWRIAFIAAAILLLVKLKPGVGITFFVIGGINLIWLIQDLRFMYGGIMQITGSVIPTLLEAAAFILAGVICVASTKVPKSSGFVALPCILVLVGAIFVLVNFFWSVAHGFGANAGIMALRLLLILAENACVILALYFACQWTMGEFTTQQSPVPAVAAGYPAAGEPKATAPNMAVSSATIPAGAPVQPFTWFCPQCGHGGNTTPLCAACGTQAPERIAGEIAASQQAASQQYAASAQIESQPSPYVQPSPQNAQDTGSFGWAVLGFFVPLAGLILWIVWKSEKPLSAKKAGMGALVGVIASVVLTIIEFAILAAMGSSMYY